MEFVNRPKRKPAKYDKWIEIRKAHDFYDTVEYIKAITDAGLTIQDHESCLQYYMYWVQKQF